MLQSNAIERNDGNMYGTSFTGCIFRGIHNTTKRLKAKKLFGNIVELERTWQCPIYRGTFLANMRNRKEKIDKLYNWHKIGDYISEATPNEKLTKTYRKAPTDAGLKIGVFE